MYIKVNCCECGDTLYLYAKEENRRKATRCKRIITPTAKCGSIGKQCYSESNPNVCRMNVE